MEVNSSQRAAIHFGNVFENESFAHSLIVVRGFINFACNEESVLLVYQLNNGARTLKARTQVQASRFVTVLDLDQGKNEFYFDIGGHVCRRTFFYRPAITNYVVTPMYIRCEEENDNTDRETDTLCPLMDMCERITLGCRLIQTIIAETLHQCGYGRKTFSLEQGDQNGNNCIVFNSKLNWNAVLGMTSEQLWEHLGREIMTSEYGCKNRKFLAFLSSYSKDEYSKHLAIGGGGLALCDAKYLKTWPASVDGINSSFYSENNSLNVLTESSFSNSLGAVCHELCHTFDLGHTMDGIMGRDFDQVGKLFVTTEYSFGSVAETTTKPLNFDCVRNCNDSLIFCEGSIRRQLNINFSVTGINNVNLLYDGNKRTQKQELVPPPGRRTNLNEIFSKKGYWFGGCATLLAYHRWINHDRNTTNADTNLHENLHYDHIRSIVTSTHGIVIVQLRNHDGYILKYWEFCEKRKKKLFLVPICEVRRSSSIVIEDTEGNLLKQDIEHLL